MGWASTILTRPGLCDRLAWTPCHGGMLDCLSSLLFLSGAPVQCHCVRRLQWCFKG